MSECELDAVRYPLAMHHMRYGTEAQRNQLAFHIADAGEQLSETWSDWHLGMGATDHIPGMYYFATGGDGSRYGQLHSPLGTSLTAATNCGTAHAYYFPAKSATNITYIYRVIDNGTSVIRQKFSADLATFHGGLSTAAGSAAIGRPAYWGGKWYVPCGGNAGDVYRLQTVADPPTADTWDTMTWVALSLSTFTAGGTAKIARGYNTNQVALATAAPLATADPGSWGGGTSVGDTSTTITDMVENQGLLFVAKEDNLYEFDSDAIARPVLPFGVRVGQDADNGKGMLAFADMIFYPSVGGLWRYRVGQSARPVGIDTIGSYADVSNPAAPIRLRHRGLTNIGEWLWMVYTDGVTTYPLAARFRHPDDPSGHELVWHTPAIATAQPGKAIFVTPDQKLIFQSAANNASLADSYFPLGADGSPASFSGGSRSSGGQFVMGETDFGKPMKRKQIKANYLDFDSSGQSVTVRAHLDSGALVSYGSRSTSGVLNPTPGTGDKCFRYRPNLTPNSLDVILRRLTVEARTASIYRVVIDGSDEALSQYGLSAEDARLNLMRLVNKGPVDVIGPDGVVSMTSVGGTPTAWQGYVEKLTEVAYETDSGLGHGFELLIARYTTDGN